MSTRIPDQHQRLNWRLLIRYLTLYRGQVVLLGAILAATLAVQLITPLVASVYLDAAVGDASLDILLTLAGLTMVLAVIGQGVAIAETWVAERLSWSVTNSLREQLARHLLHLDDAFHHAHTPGELLERVDGDVGAVARLFSRFTVYVVGNGLLVLGILALLCAVDWRIGLGLTLFTVIALGTVLWMRARAVPYSAAERQAAAEFYGFLSEYLAGLEDIQASGARGFVLRRCAGTMRAWLRATLRAQLRGYAMVSVSKGLFGLGMAFAMAVSAVRFREHALTIGAVFLIFRYAEMLRGPTEQIRHEIQDLQHAGASLGRIEALLAARSRLVDGPRAALPPGPLDIEVREATFGYAPGVPVLRDVTFRLEAQRVLGVVGRTGSGKTTLMRILTRFADPDAGAVLLGGVDLREVTREAVRSRVGLVTQEAHLFGASVRDNLTLFDASVPDARLLTVLDDLGLGPWLRALPAGLDTRLGAGGQGLSAGQTQVLACARLLLREPDVVILDEPSSKLDPATERLVHRAFGRLLAGRTGIIVAHRLSTFSLVDDILVMEHGDVQEHGPRLDLAADPNSRYARLLRLAAGEVLA